VRVSGETGFGLWVSQAESSDVTKV
jgi:hypothetical protein